MLRAIIIDDESSGINTLKLMIEKYTSAVKVVATTVDPQNGIQLINDYQPDIVFLDVSMPQMDGFELLQNISWKKFKLIFTTAHPEYALHAIKSKAYDYLLKPIDQDELISCIGNLTGHDTLEVQLKTNQLIELNVKDGIIFIKPEQIIRLEASGSYTEFYLDGGTKHIASKTLKEYEPQLHPSLFYRCHISHIINLSKVEKLLTTDGLFAQMTDGSLPVVSRKNKDTLLEKLKNI